MLIEFTRLFCVFIQLVRAANYGRWWLQLDPDNSALMADMMAHTEDNIVVCDMSVRATLKVTSTLF